MKFLPLCFSFILFPPLTGHKLHSQIYVGANAPSILARTFDLYGFYFLKNEDWLSFHAGGGYTTPGPFVFARSGECLKKFLNSGMHTRLGVRVGLTMDHHDNYPFWGLSFLYQRNWESAVQTFCDTLDNDIKVRSSTGIFSAALQAGWSWCPFRNHSIDKRLQVDFGIQAAFPAWRSAESLSYRTYFSGTGFGNLPLQSIHFGLIGLIRYEIWHGRYGYFKAGKRHRKSEPPTLKQLSRKINGKHYIR